MSSIPRILPLVGVAIGGVLAINALSGASALPDLLSGAKAFAETAAKPEKGKPAAKEAPPAAANAGNAAADASTVAPAASAKPPVCAPTAAELAKEAGLSPAELQVLQSLGARRGQLDQRESDLNTQLALMAAAEAKLDAKVNALNGLKADIQTLLKQTESKDNSEVDRLVKVFEGMKPKDAAPRMVLLDDAVRLPIAAKMKERSLSAVLAQMPPQDAKKLTESLANRFAAAKVAAANIAAAANATTTKGPDPSPAGSNSGAPGETPRKAKTKPVRPARKAAPAVAEASAAKTPATPADADPAAAAPKAG